MLRQIFLLIFMCSAVAFSQTPPITPGVSQELAKWRASHYSDVRYKLNLTLEKMSPVLKGTIEVRVKIGDIAQDGSPPYKGGVDAALGGRGGSLLVLDWRKTKGHETLSTISNVKVNGNSVTLGSLAKNHPVGETPPPLLSKEGSSLSNATYREESEHLIFRDGVVIGENVITLDFTSPILASGSAITRYIDKEDGSEYIYSLFVPSDASTAFPVFDQPDLKARFTLSLLTSNDWTVVSNTFPDPPERVKALEEPYREEAQNKVRQDVSWTLFAETKPISTYVFAFAAGPFERVNAPSVSSPHVSKGSTRADGNVGSPKSTQPDASVEPSLTVGLRTPDTSIYVRKSQAAKFKPHAAEVFRLNRESIKYFEEYFDYKFPFPKYDLVLIPEFPFGGMEHAGATFLRESAIIFPQEPTKSDHISRAVLIFHEAAHQWFGDTVTMKWFDDLWLKEGFANFMAYKAVDKIMPEANAWKVFYERIKQPAYATDSTRGTTPIYQPIDNLNSAKSAYGNIVYNKAPAFLKQAEFYFGQDNFRFTINRFLKKSEFSNATWEDLMDEFRKVKVTNFRVTDITSEAELRSINDLNRSFTENVLLFSVLAPGVPQIRLQLDSSGEYTFHQPTRGVNRTCNVVEFLYLVGYKSGNREQKRALSACEVSMDHSFSSTEDEIQFVIPNVKDYGYGIFLLDDKSREYVLKNVQNEKDAFLRSMMYGALWDSVREGELDPRTYVEVAIRNLPTEQDETIAQMMTSRSATALNYYMSDERVSSPHVSKGSTSSTANVEPSLTVGLRTRFESVLIERIKNAPTLGQRITFFRTLVANATTERSRGVLKGLLAAAVDRPRDVKAELKEAFKEPNFYVSMRLSKEELESFKKVETSESINLRTKDKFDIVTRLAVLNDPDAARLLAELEKTETTDDAKRYAYAARAAFPTQENRAKYWNDFVNKKDISESWIEAAFGPFNAVRNSELSLPFLRRALEELPNHKRNRKIFFVNGWLGAFIGGQRSLEALDIVNKFLTDNPNLDKDLRLKILENVDVIERGVKIRTKFAGDSTQRR